MDGRLALIVGGASGLGRATAERLARDGLRIAVADLNQEMARSVAADLPGVGHLGIEVDVADESSIVALFDTTEAARGPVAVLGTYAGINSAAGSPGRVPISEMGADAWDRVMTVNARGTFLCVREMMRRRSAQPVHNARIVIIGSMAGQIGGIGSDAAYSMTKGAVLVLAKVAAREGLTLGLTVNAIAPGPIDTPLLRSAVIDGDGDDFSATWSDLPLGRLGRAEEVAAAAAYLVSADAAFVTGATIDVNGGMNMR